MSNSREKALRELVDEWRLRHVTPEDCAEEVLAILDAPETQEAEEVPWKCKANRTADPPQDCDWPFCGCDPYADKVIEALQESGKLAPAEEVGELHNWGCPAFSSGDDSECDHVNCPASRPVKVNDKRP